MNDAKGSLRIIFQILTNHKEKEIDFFLFSIIMYFIVFFQPTGERSIYQNDDPDDKLKVKDLLEWIQDHFHFESSSGETGNRRLLLQYNNTELQEQWFLSDIGISIGSTVKCVVKEGFSSIDLN